MHQVHVQPVLIRRWHDDNDKDGALDVTVTGPLVKTNVRAAVAEAGSSLSRLLIGRCREQQLRVNSSRV